MTRVRIPPTLRNEVGGALNVFDAMPGLELTPTYSAFFITSGGWGPLHFYLLGLVMRFWPDPAYFDTASGAPLHPAARAVLEQTHHRLGEAGPEDLLQRVLGAVVEPSASAPYAGAPAAWVVASDCPKPTAASASHPTAAALTNGMINCCSPLERSSFQIPASSGAGTSRFGSGKPA